MSLATLLIAAAILLALLDLFPVIPSRIPLLAIAVLLLGIALLLATSGGGSLLR